MTDIIDTATLTGLVDLQRPDPATITVAALAHGLARIIRWNGALELPVVVAQHSVLVYDLFIAMFPAHRGQAIFALLHDGHEYLFGDLTKPQERLLASLFPGFSKHVANIKHYLDEAIRSAPAFQLPRPDMQTMAMIHDADMVAADIEWRLLMPAANGTSPFAAWREKTPMAVRSIKALPPAQAEILFSQTLARELAARSWELAA